MAKIGSLIGQETRQKIQPNRKRKPKRLDGITKLSDEEKNERDARAKYWMDQRKIERIQEGAERHGWYDLPLADIAAAFPGEDMPIGTEISIAGDGVYRIEIYDISAEMVKLRKIATFGVADTNKRLEAEYLAELGYATEETE